MPNGVMEPFRPAPLKISKQEWVEYRILHGMTAAEAEAAWARYSVCDFYENDIYLVQVDKQAPHAFKDAEIWMLWISRKDNDFARDWRDLQAIKNQLVGKEVEAVELYPADSRLCDASNRTGLFCFLRLNGAASPQFPVGLTRRIVSDVSLTPMELQRPFE